MTEHVAPRMELWWVLERVEICLGLSMNERHLSASLSRKQQQNCHLSKAQAERLVVSASINVLQGLLFCKSCKIRSTRFVDDLAGVVWSDGVAGCSAQLFRIGTETHGPASVHHGEGQILATA